jgi:hypothetical protein
MYNDRMKICAQCNTGFDIRNEDRVFYGKMDVPEPTMCPYCRRQRRLAWRNERHLYRRTCDLCKKDLISCHTVDSELTIYCNDCWWSDSWDRYAQGRDFDFSRPFFEQFHELQKVVPHFALHQDSASINCEYTNYGVENKSCYMAMCAYAENVYFSHGAIKTKDCIDVTKVVNCERCYECVDCSGCSRLLFSRNCTDCHDSMFLINCQNSKNCFGSSNLKHKEYVFLNKQLIKEEYEAKMAGITLDNQKIEEMQNYMQKISEQSVHRSYLGVGSQNSSGDYLDNAKNCYQCFDMLGAEDCAYCLFLGYGANNMWDCSYGGVQSNMAYESASFTGLNNAIGFMYGRTASDCYYTQYCYASHHLFGCLAMNHGEYVILNKKYPKEEYEALIPKIIEHVKQNGEWGEFFPAKYSPYGYNETVAQEYFPLSKEEILSRGLKWKEIKQEISKREASDMVKSCKECSKQFLIIQHEKKFYEGFHLPIPEKCPDCRHQRRFALRSPQRLHNRKCDKCQKALQSTYAPDRHEIVYCEECYLGEVY